MIKAGKVTGAALVALMVIGGGAAWARGNDRGPDFSTLDADGDGRVTQAELQAAGQVRFAAVDTNGDGVLSLEELQAQGSHRAARRAAHIIERFDADGYGALSLEELPRRGGDRAERMFSRMDSDSDGAISEAEFDAARAEMRAHMKERRGGFGGDRDSN